MAETTLSGSGTHSPPVRSRPFLLDPSVLLLGRPLVVSAAAVVAAVLAVRAAIWVVRAGDAGARLVWHEESAGPLLR